MDFIIQVWKIPDENTKLKVKQSMMHLRIWLVIHIINKESREWILFTISNW